MTAYHDACIVGLFGATGSGKSARARQLIEQWKPKRLIMVDPLDEYGQYARPYSSVEKLSAALEKGAMHVRWVPGRLTVSGAVNQFNTLAGVAYETKACFVVEELNLYTTASRAPPNWRNCTLRGRHQGMTILGISQRPAGVDKDFFSNATVLRSCRLNYAEDVRCIAGVLNVRPDEVTQITRAKGEGWFVGRYIERDLDANVVTFGIMELGKPPKNEKKRIVDGWGQGGAIG